MFCPHEAKWFALLLRLPGKWLLLQLAACWLNWLVRVPLRVASVVHIWPGAQRGGGLEQISRVKPDFQPKTAACGRRYRSKPPRSGAQSHCCFWTRAGNFIPFSIYLQLTRLQRSHDWPSWLQSELLQVGDRDQTISCGNCVANCTSVETRGAEKTSFGALMHQMQFWNSKMLLEEGYLLLQSITILPSSPVSALIAPVCAHSEACLVNIHCFPFKCLIICMGNTGTHCDGRVLCIKSWGRNFSCVSQPKKWEWSSLRLYSH